MVPNVAAREDPTEVDLDSESATTSATAAPAEAAVATPAADGPTCTQQHVLNCQFGQWHPIFRHCTPRSVALELPQDVVRYLQQDGVVLPKGFGMSCGEGAQDDSDDEVDWGDESDEEDGDQRVSKASMSSQILRHRPSLSLKGIVLSRAAAAGAERVACVGGCWDGQYSY